MSASNTGGPAFPMPANEYAGHGPHWGMTLLDHFAGQALQGLTTAQNSEGTWRFGDPNTVAETAYEIARAMLAERNKQGEV